VGVEKIVAASVFVRTCMRGPARIMVTQRQVACSSHGLLPAAETHTREQEAGGMGAYANGSESFKRVVMMNEESF